MSRTLLGPAAQSSRYICANCSNRIRTATVAQRTFTSNRALRQQRQTQKSILALLEERGYINQLAGDRHALDTLLQTRKTGFYAGVDPTAPSLHLGHLLPFMVLFWLYHHGHHVVSLVGGGTARVGDPSGRLVSRAEVALSVHSDNLASMRTQLDKLWGNVERYGRRHGFDAEGAGGGKEVLDNGTWLDKLNILEFLRIVGNGVRMGTMLGRDTVRNKMEKGDGMSFAEFTYPLLQGWDWWHMFRERKIQVQVGGGDQFGNIVAGMDAVKYIVQHSASEEDKAKWLDGEGRLREESTPMGLTVPLLTTASGEKFGKSAGNALWLDETMTSAFDLYGFLLRSSDGDVARYLKLFTFVSTEEIAAVMVTHASDPGKRHAQHLLASEVLELVHGPEQAAKTRAEHQALRNPSLASLISKTNEPGSTTEARTLLPSSLITGTSLSRILYHAGIVKSKSEGARSVAKGGVYIALQNASEDGELKFASVKDLPQSATALDYVVDGLLVFRIGKWKVRVIEVVDDADFEKQGLDAPGWQEWKSNQ
ncbi:tyrosyl-tRNA synthetase [Acrodontium crateriforme]|uniref:Tyrosine--tRNA ligase n=1 Tax=Acrodontium crateriforme TaxID=150365 RepID=A0AAQ3LZL5_9PEZI|nr:tyrosyl-tRNA synthetase [Acrodontium crateriforme]